MTSRHHSSAKLTDTQLVLLSSASQREDRLAVRPVSLKPAAHRAALKALLTRGLFEEVETSASQPGWRSGEDGLQVGAKITLAGFEALGLTPEPEEATDESGPRKRRRSKAAAETSSTATIRSDDPAQAGPATGSGGLPARPGTKQALIIDLLRRESGATLGDLIAATGWLPHTTRAALTGLRRKGYVLQKSKGADGSTLYRIVESGTAPSADARQAA